MAEQQPTGSEHVDMELPSPQGDGERVQVEGELATYDSLFTGRVSDPMTALADAAAREFKFLRGDEDSWLRAAGGIAAKLAEHGFQVAPLSE